MSLLLDGPPGTTPLAPYWMRMHRPVLDWVSRVVMLVLAGLVSLSIIGAIAAIPSASLESQLGISQPDRPSPPAEPKQRPDPAAEVPGSPEAGAGGEVSIAGAAPEDPGTEAARWLEAITYALLALAGITALATLLLWRSLAERRRAAEALEALLRER